MPVVFRRAFADSCRRVAGLQPRRDALGNLRPFFRPGSDNPSNSLDHVHYRGVEPLALRVDRSQDALECSDHSPVVFTFIVPAKSKRTF